MIYYFSYRYGELQATVHADCEFEAWTDLLNGRVPIEINPEMLNSEMWELGGTEEEDYDRQ